MNCIGQTITHRRYQSTTTLDWVIIIIYFAQQYKIAELYKYQLTASRTVRLSSSGNNCPKYSAYSEILFLGTVYKCSCLLRPLTYRSTIQFGVGVSISGMASCYCQLQRPLVYSPISSFPFAVRRALCWSLSQRLVRSVISPPLLLVACKFNKARQFFSARLAEFMVLRSLSVCVWMCCVKC